MGRDFKRAFSPESIVIRSPKCSVAHNCPHESLHRALMLSDGTHTSSFYHKNLTKPSRVKEAPDVSLCFSSDTASSFSKRTSHKAETLDICRDNTSRDGGQRVYLITEELKEQGEVTEEEEECQDEITEAFLWGLSSCWCKFSEISVVQVQM